MSQLRVSVLAAIASMVSGCGQATLPQEIPALLVEPDAAARRELQQVISNALHQEDVMIADDALTTSSELSFEPAAPRGINAPPATGRQLGRPEVFRLLRDGPQCLLEHRRTGLRWILADAECVTE